MNDRSLSQLLRQVVQISERAADESGFVPLHALAREIQADVSFRPLLVEGVAAQPKDKDGRWLILIDNETHRVSAEMFQQETAARPLGSRLRNTIAHELAHTLGPRFEAAAGNGKSRKEQVKHLEDDTEDVSPALLIPPRAVEALLSERPTPFSVDELVGARDRMSVSSRVFVKRLELLNQEADNRFRYHPRFDNVVIGSGEWLSSTKVELHPMPFRGVRGIVPEFVTQLRTHKKISLGDYVTDPDFYLCGGSSPTAEMKLWLGTGARPKSEQGAVIVSVEAVPRKAGNGFLWMARVGEVGA